MFAEPSCSTFVFADTTPFPAFQEPGGESGGPLPPSQYFSLKLLLVILTCNTAQYRLLYITSYACFVHMVAANYVDETNVLTRLCKKYL